MKILSAALVIGLGGLAFAGTEETIQQASSRMASCIDEVSRKHNEGFHGTARSSMASAVSSIDSLVSMYNRNVEDNESFIKQLETDRAAANGLAVGGLKAIASAGTGSQKTAAAAFSKRLQTLVDVRRDDLGKDQVDLQNAFRTQAAEFRAALLLGAFNERAKQTLEYTNFANALSRETDQTDRMFTVDISRLPSDVQQKLVAAVRSTLVEPFKRVLSEERNEFAIDLLTADEFRAVLAKVKEAK